jgi:hypothetical protein
MNEFCASGLCYTCHANSIFRREMKRAEKRAKKAEGTEYGRFVTDSRLKNTKKGIQLKLVEWELEEVQAAIASVYV